MMWTSKCVELLKKSFGMQYPVYEYCIAIYEKVDTEREYLCKSNSDIAIPDLM